MLKKRFGFSSMFSTFLVAICCLGVAGCGGSDTPPASNGEESGNKAGDDEHAHSHDQALPTTLIEAAAELAEHRDELAAAYAEGKKKPVDDTLHDFMRIANSLEGLAKKSKLDRYDLADAIEAGKQISGILIALHDAAGGHSKSAKFEKADYDKQADSLNEAIDKLATLAAKQTE